MINITEGRVSPSANLLNKFEHFDSSVSIELAEKMLCFINFAKDNFISEFRDSQASAEIDTRSHLYNYHSGGFVATEQYRNDEDPCSHFTKEQTAWKDKQAAQSLVDFCKEWEIDTDTALEEEWGERLSEWEEDLHESALLELRCSVTKGKVLVDLALDYEREVVFDWNLLYEKEFTVKEFMELEFERFFEGLVNVVNDLE